MTGGNKVLIVGFSRKTLAEIKKILYGRSVKAAAGLTDMKHKLVDEDFDILVINADVFSNADILIAHQTQAKTGKHTIAVHGDKCKKTSAKYPQLFFSPISKVFCYLQFVDSQQVMTT